MTEPRTNFFRDASTLMERLVRYTRTGCEDMDCMCGGTMEEDVNGHWVKVESVRQLLEDVIKPNTEASDGSSLC